MTPPIYYINLTRRPDRRAFMESQLNKLGLAGTRIEAVTPDALTSAERDRPINPMTGLPLPEPALCCGLSHLRVLETMLARSEPWAVVLEDDAVLSASLPAFLTAFAAAPPRAAIVRIEAAAHANLTLWRSDLTIGGVRLHRYIGYDIGSAGYLISAGAARVVLASPEPRRRDIDVAMFNDLSPLARQLKPLQANPALCIQAQSLSHENAYAQSDLTPLRTPSQLSPWGRLRVAFQRDVSQQVRKGWRRLAHGGIRTRVPFNPD